MAGILLKQNSTNTLTKHQTPVTICPGQKSVAFKVDQENMDVRSQNFIDKCAESVSVWSPPNTPPNKFAFPSFPSLSPHDLNPLRQVDSKDMKITPPRGRPKAEMINYLMVEGAQSRSPIRCDICGRVFPREKSLQAHKRTHSGDRPYTCDFPSCDKAFVQSGQLKTHQRLHTGEKPFMCTIPGCNSRFTHANRHCPTHPKAGLTRQDSEVIPLKRALLSEIQNKEPNEQTKNVLLWLDKYERGRQDKSPGAVKMKREKRAKDRDQAKSQLSERRKAKVEARHRLAEQRERWFGALALVELAALNTVPVHKSLNFHFPHQESHVELL